MATSIIQTDKRCFICHSERDLERHHVWHGTAKRKKADADGLWVWLCHDCHTDLHDHGAYDELLMQIGEAMWLIRYGGSKDGFIERYGKNVL